MQLQNSQKHKQAAGRKRFCFMVFLKGIHKTGPRPDVDVFDVAAQVYMHAQLKLQKYMDV
jgi:hypothetical protein